MRLLGLQITRATKSSVPVTEVPPFSGSGGGWFNIIREPFTGAWQRNQSTIRSDLHSNHAVYSCETLIATDVSKCRPKLVEQDKNGIWNEVSVAAFSPVLTKPNNYQNRIQFFEQWIISKLSAGNTYVLKGRDQRGVVNSLYILNPLRATPLVTPSGDVYYRLKPDNLSGLDGEGDVVVPASEIIHDVMVPLYHPLCGVSPLVASALAAAQGMSMQRSMEKLFRNGVQPGGILTAPSAISDPDADRFKKYFEENFTGENSGRIAVLGGGLKFEAITMKAVDAQLIEQLKWTATVVCGCYHVPAYKVGVGDPPPYQNVQATEQQYYSQCLQKFFECIELLLDEGLGLTNVQGHTYGVEFDLDDLLRMDTATLIESEVKAVGGGIKKPDESRKRLNLPPVKGGDTPYLQQQNFSLSALDRRDKSDDPFALAPKRDQHTPTAADDAAAEAAANAPPPAPGKLFRTAANITWKFMGNPVKQKEAA